MLVISTAYEFLSLITFTLGLCIATLAALKSFTRISPLSNRVEPIYIAILALTVSLWSFMPIFRNNMALSSLWQWISLLVLVISISWYTIFVCNRIMPLESKYRRILWVAVILLVIAYGGLLITSGDNLFGT